MPSTSRRSRATNVDGERSARLPAPAPVHAWIAQSHHPRVGRPSGARGPNDGMGRLGVLLRCGYLERVDRRDTPLRLGGGRSLSPRSHPHGDSHQFRCLRKRSRRPHQRFRSERRGGGANTAAVGDPSAGKTYLALPGADIPLIGQQSGFNCFHAAPSGSGGDAPEPSTVVLSGGGLWALWCERKRIAGRAG